MNQINATISINAARLNRPLRTWYAKQLRSFVVELTDIPDDTSSIVCRVFGVGGATYTDVPVSRRGNSSGICYIIGTIFTAAGEAKYEVHAYDAKGNATALGDGVIHIEAFSQAAEPITPGVAVPLTQIRDANGNYHTISAVQDDTGNYTSVIDA